jgi:hypothetical protein
MGTLGEDSKKRKRPVLVQLTQKCESEVEGLRHLEFTKEAGNFKVRMVTRRDMLYLAINEVQTAKVPEIMLLP